MPAGLSEERMKDSRIDLAVRMAFCAVMLVLKRYDIIDHIEIVEED